MKKLLTIPIMIITLIGLGFSPALIQEAQGNLFCQIFKPVKLGEYYKLKKLHCDDGLPTSEEMIKAKKELKKWEILQDRMNENHNWYSKTLHDHVKDKIKYYDSIADPNPVIWNHEPCKQAMKMYANMQQGKPIY